MFFRHHILTKLITLFVSLLGAMLVVILGSGVRVGSVLRTLSVPSEAKVLKYTIDTDSRDREISPAIYGVAGAPQQVLRDTNAQVNRWGGNTASRYNWKMGNVWNVGRDWFFENQPIEDDAWQSFIENSLENDSHAIITIPLVGYIAKDGTSYSFSVEKYGSQQKTDPYNPDAGNGIKPDGTTRVRNDPEDASRRVGKDYMREWIKTIRTSFPEAVKNGRIVFALGNEPMLWDKTHRDVHPLPITYDEYLERYIDMAEMIRSTAPKAPIAGPELWGWPAFFESAYDRENTGQQDRRAHNNRPFLPWFLSRLADYEKRHGKKLLDILTVHYYPQAAGVNSDETSRGAVYSRVNATRSLYDAEYTDPSWIKQQITLIPRLKKWVDQNYPGLKIGITEYKWGGEKHISGGIAIANFLGILASRNVHLACYWQHPPPNSFAESAFQLYAGDNSDKKGFGDYALPVANAITGENHSQNRQVRIYAARRRNHPRDVVIIAVNSGKKDCPVELTFTNCSDMELSRASRISTDHHEIESFALPIKTVEEKAEFTIGSTSILRLLFRCPQ